MSKVGNILGLDIGGANIKLSTSDGQYVRTIVFSMWSQYSELANTISKLLGEYQNSHGTPQALAITMTGELADCFQSKCDGVVHISNAVLEAAQGIDEIWFYKTGGDWCTARDAESQWPTLAASNWHAMAQYCGQAIPKGTHIVVDIGTTTTDIIPLSNGKVATEATDDISRLQQGQLVYCGVERTSLSSLVSDLLIDGIVTPVARELFATTLDTFLLTGEIPERPSDRNTADGHSVSKEAAHRRIARLICQCPELLSESQTQQMAQQTRNAVVQLLSSALRQVTAEMTLPVDSIIAVGQGTFLLSDIASGITIRQLHNLHPEGCDNLARIGPAFAVAVLLERHLRMNK